MEKTQNNKENTGDRAFVLSPLLSRTTIYSASLYHLLSSCHHCVMDGNALMPRITGLAKNQAPWHLRWFYSMMRKMFGRDLTPATIQMRVPGLIWGSIGMEAGLGKKRRVSLRYTQLGKVRAASRIGCPF